MPSPTTKVPLWIKLGAIAGFISAAMVTVLLIWVIALQGAVSNLAESTGKFLTQKFTLKEAPINADFSMPGFGWFGTLVDYIWSPGFMVFGIIAYVVIKKFRSSRRRPHRPAPSSPTNP